VIAAAIPYAMLLPTDECFAQEFILTTLVVIGTGCIVSCKSNYHTITMGGIGIVIKQNCEALGDFDNI
jgi:hypothetical protein